MTKARRDEDPQTSWIPRVNVWFLLFLAVFLTGSFIRILPAAAYDMPLRYDSYYHIRAAQFVKDTGGIPFEDPWPEGGRPHLYPPFYHVSLAGLSTLTGASVMDVGRFFLPVISCLTILAIFLVVRRLQNEKTAVLASLLFAFNPYLLSSAYDSPQVVGIFLAVFAMYCLVKEKYWQGGLLVGTMFMFDFFSAFMFSVAFAIFLIVSRKVRKAPQFYALPSLFLAAWFLPRMAGMYCLDSSLGAYFIDKATHGLIIQEAFLIIPVLLIAFALTQRVKDDFQKLAFVMTCFFTVMFLSFLVTPAFHPWRQDLYVSLGFAFLLPTLLTDTGRIRRLFFSFFFISIFVSSYTYFVFFMGLSPPLYDHEYAMVDWLGNLAPNARLLAPHDVCAATMTLTSHSCLLDLNFECLKDKQAFRDYENYFWTERPEQLSATIQKYGIDYVAYQSNMWNEPVLEQTRASKVFTSWMCRNTLCAKSDSVYKPGSGSTIVRVDDVWPLENNSLAEWGYDQAHLEATLAVLEKHTTRALLSVTPFFYDQEQNKTLFLAGDSRVLGLINSSGFEVALHGYSHYCTPDGCEFDAKTAEQDAAMLASAKAYVENVTGQSVRYFVAPKDRFTPELKTVVNATGLLLQGRVLYDPIAEWQWPNKTVTWHGFSDFKASFKKDADYAIVLHYNALDASRLQELDALLAWLEKQYE